MNSAVAHTQAAPEVVDWARAAVVDTLEVDGDHDRADYHVEQQVGAVELAAAATAGTHTDSPEPTEVHRLDIAGIVDRARTKMPNVVYNFDPASAAAVVAAEPDAGKTPSRNERGLASSHTHSSAAVAAVAVVVAEEVLVQLVPAGDR